MTITTSSPFGGGPSAATSNRTASPAAILGIRYVQCVCWPGNSSTGLAGRGVGCCEDGAYGRERGRTREIADDGARGDRPARGGHCGSARGDSGRAFRRGSGGAYREVGAAFTRVHLPHRAGFGGVGDSPSVHFVDTSDSVNYVLTHGDSLPISNTGARLILAERAGSGVITHTHHTEGTSVSHGNTPMPFSGDQTPASTGSGELVPFITPGGNPVRVIVIDGEPEFVAADACRILEHSNPSAAVAGLDDDERGLRIVETPSGAQRMVTVTEAGLYSLIIRSRKPEAKAFRRWITHEVLPAIRKTGGYGHAPALEGPELLAHAVLEAQKMIAAKDERIAELEPKAAPRRQRVRGVRGRVPARGGLSRG